MRRRCSITLGVLLCLIYLSFVYSAGVLAMGEGDGGGAGPSLKLSMQWSYPANGEKNVSVTPIIQCKFSHNVAQSNVLKRNVTLFSLTKLDGTPVAINVYAADAQLEFDKRQHIYVEPIKPLEYNTTYIVKVKAGIQAKNSMATEKDQTFQFTTCGRRIDFNETNVSPMIEEEKNQPESKEKQIKPSITNEDGEKEKNPQESALTEKSADSPAGKSVLASGSQREKNETVLTLKNPVLATCLAAGFLLILSIMMSVFKIKRQK